MPIGEELHAAASKIVDAILYCLLRWPNADLPSKRTTLWLVRNKIDEVLQGTRLP